jgi:hypothetical protein
MHRRRWFTTVAIGLCVHAFVARAGAGRLEIPNAAQPQLTLGSDGRVWMAYGRLAEATPAAKPVGDHTSHGDAQKHKGHQPASRSGEVFVVSSTDGGATFTPAVKVAALPKLMLGNRRGPRIAAHGNRLTVTLVSDELVAFSSTDGGQTWSQPVTINSVTTCAREGLHDLAVAPDGRLFVTWLDLRNGKMELWGAWSQDGGRAWGANEQVYKSPDKSICECCHPSALFDADGTLAVMWRNSIEGSRDMWMTTRAKSAQHFSSPRKLGESTWKLNACPMDGGRLLVLDDGKFGAVWQRNGQVFFTPDQGAEVTLGAGKQPVVISNEGKQPLVVWQQGTDLVSTAVATGASPMKRASDARFPSVIAFRDGTRALLAYEQGLAKGPTQIVVERL